jgi:aminopeptidase N
MVNLLGSPNSQMRRLISMSFLLALALAGCGGGSSDSSEHENASPATARKEVAETRAALNAAVASYKAGDRAKAVDQVSEAYVTHFEEVEGPLEGKDDELKESLEHAIAGDLRAAMKAGKPKAAVDRQVQSILADLDKADAALR